MEDTSPAIYQQYLDEPIRDLYRHGNELLAEGRLDEAMTCFTIVGNRYQPDLSAEERRLCAYALNNAGGIAQIRFSNAAAFSYFKRAMQLADEPIYQSYNNIAGIYLFYNDYANARRYLNEAFDISLDKHDWQALSNSLRNLMFLNWCTDSLQLSADLIRRYEQASEIPHDSVYEETISTAHGMQYVIRHDYAGAATCFRQNIARRSDPSGNGDNALSELLYLAHAYQLLDSIPQALSTLRQAEQMAQQNGANDILLRVYKELTDYYTLTGDQESLHQAKYQYMSLKDSINAAEEYGKIKNIEFLTEVERYEQQVIQLNEEKHTRSLVAIISSVGLLLVVIMLVIVVRQKRRLEASYQSLFRKNEELIKAPSKLSAPAPSNLPPKGEAFGVTSAMGIASPLGGEVGEGLASPFGGRLEGAVRLEGAFVGLQEKISEKMEDVSFISQSDLTVERLAQAIGVHERYVSQFINEQMNKNFNTLLNEYRIREICKRLTDFEHYGTLTNETIAEGLGYKSRSHFTRTFKKITGLTPTQYQRIAKQEKN